MRRKITEAKLRFAAWLFTLYEPNHLRPFKAEETGALEGELAMIALNDVAILMGRHMQLHPVATVHLEGDIVAGGMVCVVIVMVMRNIRPFGYHRGSYGQARRIVIFIPLTNASYNHDNNNSEYQDEHQRKHYAEHPETKIKSKSHIICLSALRAVQCNSKSAPDQAGLSACGRPLCG